MVSLWPWKGEDSSPATFERILSTLSKKITDTQAQLDRVRSNSRRIKVIWTLYLSFAYLVYAIVLTLVVGWQNLGPWEWTGMAGGPVLIYGVRTVTTAYFNYRIDTLESRMKEHQSERAKTIQKLKDATKYDSTLELLEKYGGEKRPRVKRQPTGGDEAADQEKKGANNKGSQSLRLRPHAGRTSVLPPPTANIPRPSTAPGTPQTHGHLGRPYPSPPPLQQPTAEFAPNAGPLPSSSYPQQYDTPPGPPRWYDRILDLMLGEDETLPKNRIVLICNSCRLVNGQAPPGTKSLAELGTWKCMSCGAMNGEMDEGKKIMREVFGSGAKIAASDAGSALSGDERDSDRYSDIVKVEDVDAEEGSEASPSGDHLRPGRPSKNRKVILPGGPLRAQYHGDINEAIGFYVTIKILDFGKKAMAETPMKTRATGLPLRERDQYIG
ncbi:hypothetical protein DL766_006793 [Monosporascus sp. MC13-8B]|uniref:Endoplasmic reticulum junction formation protein lunapark n=1 Tax=Monosporascus cannonballus TaxID=155416 RepID=A0ABY0H370_9PEZI|nr:hypothetical protein DL762_007283 [Monosporascus cannonballus]RYP26169.1 hypothetical protein DL766_006793 [Monosporascus sp. MC13-8B]